VLNEALRTTIKNRIRLEKEEQQEEIKKDVSNILAEASARGMIGSSVVFNKITESCGLAVRNRAQFIWDTIWRFTTTAGLRYSENLKEELIDLFSECFRSPDDIDELLNAKLEHTLYPIPPESKEALMEFFKKSRTDSIDRIMGEIDLFIMSLKNTEESEEKMSQFNFYAPVGAVQTGSNSNTNVTQAIGVDARTTLNSAFDSIMRELSQSHNFPQKDELVECVQDAKMETSKDKPNSLKLNGYILTIGSMIQATASLKPAYEVLKQGAAYFGISLP